MSVSRIFNRIKYTGRKRIDQLGKRDIDTGKLSLKRENEWVRDRERIWKRKERSTDKDKQEEVDREPQRRRSLQWNW